MKTKIKTVFLDVDGILANFRKGIHDAFDKPYDYPTLSSRWEFWDDWPDVTFEMVNAACTTSFWQNLEWMHDGHDILQAVLNKFSAKQIYLLTAPMPNIESPTGKWMWIQDNLSTYLKRIIITQAPKHLLARPDTLLIDDKNENIDKFIEAGGRGLLVNRPWNRYRQGLDSSLEVVELLLKNYQGDLR